MKVTPFFVVTIALFVCLSSPASAQLGTVDPRFNALVDTASYLEKRIDQIVELPDGKILVTGRFNHYNDQPVGSPVLLEADGGLDVSFNQHLFPANTTLGLNYLPDGKILIFRGSQILRVSPTGAIDSSFQFLTTGTIRNQFVDANGRVVLGGNFTVDRGGVMVSESIIRLNGDGSVDESFDAQLYDLNGSRMTVTGNNVAVMREANTNYELISLNEDGSLRLQTAAFPITSFLINIVGRPDGKVIVLTGSRLLQLNDNGTVDSSFQQSGPFGGLGSPQIRVGEDGKITLATQESNPGRWRFVRLLQNGSQDSAFVPYEFFQVNQSSVGTYGVQRNGGLLIGDFNISSPTSRFTRLQSNGSIDAEFNSGGTSFLTVLPGKIRAIVVLPDGKIMIGGGFQRVGGVDRRKLARLNPDGTLDTSFEIAVGVTGTYFYELNEIYSITRQSDGKFLISGSFKYYLNGVPKQLVARINPDGTVDTTFNLGVYLPDYFGANSAGPSKSIVKPGGGIVLAQSSGNSDETLKVPLGLNSNGSIDSSFTSGYFGPQLSVHVDHIAQTADGKIILSGRRYTIEGYEGFVVRLNADGSADQTFQMYKRLHYRIVNFEVQRDGKIVFAARSLNHSVVLRLNDNGTVDGDFGVETGANGPVNVITVLPNGQILIGGLFASFDGQARQNLAILDSSGRLAASTMAANGEVLSMTQDAEQKVLIGGSFTRVGISGQTANRSYVARLNGVHRVLFDYDGDGRADLSVYRPADNFWYMQRSNAGFAGFQWGAAGDRPAPADYDGDGKTDIAVFRPSEGVWYIVMSQSQTFQAFSWGANGDLPVPADHNGDGRAELVVVPELGQHVLQKLNQRRAFRGGAVRCCGGQACDRRFRRRRARGRCGIPPFGQQLVRFEIFRRLHGSAVRGSGRYSRAGRL